MKTHIISSLALTLALWLQPLPAVTADEAPADRPSKAAAFLPFDFYLRHRAELELTATQARQMDELADGLRDPAKELNAERARRTKALLEAMSQKPIPVEEAMARFQAVLEAEDRLKTLQFRAGIALRNALTAAQLTRVEELARNEGSSRPGTGPAELNARISRLRAELEKRGGDDGEGAVLKQLQVIEETARKGRWSDAKRRLEELLQQLRHEPAPAPRTKTASPPPPPESAR